MDIAERYVDLIAGLVQGRKVIVAGVPLAGTTRRIAQLRALGCDRCLVVTNGLGTGDLPDPDDADHVIVPTPARDVIDEFRQVERMLANPPEAVRTALESFDPDRSALVLAGAFLPSSHVGDRPCYGARRADWVALEDKTVCDAIFDAVGVRRPASVVVPVDRAELLRAAAQLDQGAGTVWSGDAREGFNGGGVFVRWIRGEGTEPDPDVDEALARFEPQCDRVRVAPFLEGVPCSIHGFVCHDGVAVFRPVELVNLRRRGEGRFCYAGVATYFDPPTGDRAEMREAARGVGTYLACHHGFLGAFTVDGVLTAEGWRATELNPRFGGGLGYANWLFPALPFDLLHHLVAAGDGADVSAADVEALIIPAADDTRWGGGWTSVPTVLETTRTTPVVFGNEGCRVAGDGEDADGDLLGGPGSEGGFVRLILRPDRTARGPSVAPLVTAAFALADELWRTDIGPLDPARPVR